MAARKNWLFPKDSLMNTPSRKCGIDADKELSYRQQAAIFIQLLADQFKLNQLCINTAIVYMHRFYMFHSFTIFPWNAVATASFFLATKVEEQPIGLKYVIYKANQCFIHEKNKTFDAKFEQNTIESHDLLWIEELLLQTIHFDVDVDHTHTHVVRCCYLLQVSKQVAQTSYFMASNTLFLTTLFLQYTPTVLACLCIHLASKWSNWQIPKSKENQHWFYDIDKTMTFDMLEQLSAEFLNVFDKCPARLKKKIKSITAMHYAGKQQQQRKNEERKKAMHNRDKALLACLSGDKQITTVTATSNLRPSLPPPLPLSPQPLRPPPPLLSPPPSPRRPPPSLTTHRDHCGPVHYREVFSRVVENRQPRLDVKVHSIDESSIVKVNDNHGVLDKQRYDINRQQIVDPRLKDKHNSSRHRREVNSKCQKQRYVPTIQDKKKQIVSTTLKHKPLCVDSAESVLVQNRNGKHSSLSTTAEDRTKSWLANLHLFSPPPPKKTLSLFSPEKTPQHKSKNSWNTIILPSTCKRTTETPVVFPFGSHPPKQSSTSPALKCPYTSSSSSEQKMKTMLNQKSDYKNVIQDSKMGINLPKASNVIQLTCNRTLEALMATKAAKAEGLVSTTTATTTAVPPPVDGDKHKSEHHKSDKGNNDKDKERLNIKSDKSERVKVPLKIIIVKNKLQPTSEQSGSGSGLKINICKDQTRYVLVSTRKREREKTSPTVPPNKVVKTSNYKYVDCSRQNDSSRRNNNSKDKASKLKMADSKYNNNDASKAA